MEAYSVAKKTMDDKIVFFLSSSKRQSTFVGIMNQTGKMSRRRRIHTTRSLPRLLRCICLPTH